MGERPSKDHSVERIDGSKGYSKENCRWATAKEQARNTTRNHELKHDGERLCVAEWAERLEVKAQTIRTRLKAGWSTAEALGFEKHVPKSHVGLGVKDLTGQHFGMLTVVELVATPGGNAEWLCQCDCGNDNIVTSGNLPKTKSCGCAISTGGNRKLSWESVQEMRRLWDADKSAWTYTALGKKFGCSYMQARNIVERRQRLFA